MQADVGVQEVEVSWEEAADGPVPARVVAALGSQVGVLVKVQLPLREAKVLPKPYGAACECDKQAGPRKKARRHDPQAALQASLDSLRASLDSLPTGDELTDPLVASLRAELGAAEGSPPAALPDALPAQLSARLVTHYYRPAEREAVRRCVYYLRLKTARRQNSQGGGGPPPPTGTQPLGRRTRQSGQRLWQARQKQEERLYEQLHLGAPLGRPCCRQRYREGLAQEMAAWLPLLPTPTELAPPLLTELAPQLLMAGEPLYELYRLAREEGAGRPSDSELQNWSTVCQEVLRLCRPGLGPFESAEPGTDGYAALQRLFGAGRGDEEHSTARIWIYCLLLALHRAGGRRLRGLPGELPGPDDLASANLPPAPPPVVRPLPRPYNFWPQVLRSEVDGLQRGTSPWGEPLVLLEHDLAIACASSFKFGVDLDDEVATDDDDVAADEDHGLREVGWRGQLSALGQALAIQVTRIEYVRRQPRSPAGPRYFFFFHGNGLLNPHLRRSLPLWPLLTEDGAALQEPDLLVEDEWPAPLCLDERMHDICAQWAHRPLQLLRLRDGRIGYAAELPLNAPDRQAAEAKFRSVLARWLRPFRKTVANLNKSYEFWESTEVVLDRRPPYLLKPPRRVVPLAGAEHEGTEPECRFRWQQLGWDRKLRWSDDEARDRRVLTLRSLLVGALGVLDARLNPIADVGGHEHTALRRLCVALSLLRELDPGWHCPGKLCPVSIHLGFGVWPHTYHYGDSSGPEPQVPETDFTVYVCSSHEHAFLLCKQRADNAVKLTLWDPNGSRSGTYRLLQHVCRGLALRDQHGQRLARLLGLAEAGLTEASLGCYVYPRETPTLQGDEGSCTTHALLLAAVAVVEGPDRLPRQGAQDLSDAWLLLGSALGWRWCLPPEARARLLFLPPAEADDAGADDFQRRPCCGPRERGP
eukprot:g30897.t1